MNEREINEIVGRNLRARREALGKTHQNVADILDLHVSRISKYEDGSLGISAGRLWILAQELETPLMFFFHGAPR